MNEQTLFEVCAQMTSEHAAATREAIDAARTNKLAAKLQAYAERLAELAELVKDSERG